MHSKKRSQIAAALSFPYCPKICIGDWPLGRGVYYLNQSLFATTVAHPTSHHLLETGSHLNNATPHIYTPQNLIYSCLLYACQGGVNIYTVYTQHCLCTSL